jgi:integrase
MFLSKRNDGYYYLHYKDASTRWRRVTTGSKSKVGANNYLSAFKLQEDLPAKPHEITFSEFINQYIEYSAANHTITSTTRINYVLLSFRPFIKSIELKNVTPLLIEQYKQFRLTKVKPTTLNIELRTLKAIFNKAVEWGLISASPMKYVKLLPIPEERINFISVGEFQKIMDTIKLDWLRNFVIISVNTGMRRNELINLQWNDIDFDQGIITISNQDGFTTKSKRERIIYLNEIVSDLLKRLDTSTTYVITYPNGKKLYDNYVSQCFRDAVKSSGVSRKIHLHSLRHTFASWLVQKGVSIFEVSKLLGHSNVSVTEIYSHASPENLRKSVELLKVK